ncbi:MAG: Lrp/AsnC family transcriptional regulator [Candidatus Methanomethylicia archaeon]
MTAEKVKIDEIDYAILNILQEDCRTPLEEIARKIKIPKSTVHYRIKKLEERKIIEGYYAKIDAAKLGKEYIAVILVRAKYGPGYHEKVGRKIAEIPGVWAVYFVLGEIDFVVMVRANDREDYMRILNTLMNMKEIERTSTQVVVKMIKEDPRVELPPIT